jgi:hypothetical protein
MFEIFQSIHSWYRPWCINSSDWWYCKKWWREVRIYKWWRSYTAQGNWRFVLLLSAFRNILDFRIAKQKVFWLYGNTNIIEGKKECKKNAINDKIKYVARFDWASTSPSTSSSRIQHWIIVMDTFGISVLAFCAIFRILFLLFPCVMLEMHTLIAVLPRWSLCLRNIAWIHSGIQSFINNVSIEIASLSCACLHKMVERMMSLISSAH